jgi:hypothetical protein
LHREFSAAWYPVQLYYNIKGLLTFGIINQLDAMKKVLAIIITCCSFMGAIHTQNVTAEWVRHTGNYGTDQARGMNIDHLGNVYITGSFEVGMDIDGGPGYEYLQALGTNDVFISKYNKSGEFKWGRKMGGDGLDQGFDCAIDTNGNVYTIGVYEGPSDFDPGPAVANLSGTAGDLNIFISKLDSNGNYVWAKRISGASDQFAWSIELDEQGNIYYTGGFKGVCDFDPGAGTYNLTSAGWSDIFISKLTPSGTLVWAKKFGGSEEDVAYGLTLDDNQNVYITGNFTDSFDIDPGTDTLIFQSTNNTMDIFVMKTNSAGTFEWAKQINAGGQFDSGFSVDLDQSGNIYTTGCFKDTADFDPGPGINNRISAGDYDAYIYKLDNNGNYLDAFQIGSSGADIGYDIYVNQSSDIYCSGVFNGLVAFNNTGPTQYLPSSGTQDIFLAKYNPSGNTEFVSNIGGTGSDIGFSLVQDNEGFIYLTGGFEYNTDFDPGPATLTATSYGFRDIFLVKLRVPGAGLEEENDFTCNVYPNPSADLLNIQLQAIPENIQVKLYDMRGTQVMDYLVNTPSSIMQFDISFLSPGVYMIRMENGQMFLTTRFIKI